MYGDKGQRPLPTTEPGSSQLCEGERGEGGVWVCVCVSVRERTMALAGRFLRNLARTTPLLPCARFTLPQMQRYCVPIFFVFAL